MSAKKIFSDFSADMESLWKSTLKMGTFGSEFRRGLAKIQANNLQSYNFKIAKKHFMRMYSTNLILSV